MTLARQTALDKPPVDIKQTSNAVHYYGLLLLNLPQPERKHTSYHYRDKLELAQHSTSAPMAVRGV